MRIFAPNAVVAKSRYWYFLRGLKKVKKATGEIVAVNVVCAPPDGRLDVRECEAHQFYRSARSTP